MTYFWLCIASWLALNTVALVELVRHYRSERRSGVR